MKGRSLAGLYRGVIVDVSPLRSSARFRWLFLGQLTTQVSRLTLVVAVPYEVYVLTDSIAMVGLIGLVQVVPLTVFSILGGTAADAFDRRRLLVVVQLLLAGTSGGFALNTLTGSRLWLIFVLVILNAGLAGFEAPARAAIISRLVPIPQLASAFALNQTLNQTARAAVPAIAGIVLASAGIGPAYWMSSAACLLTLLALIPVGAQTPGGASGRLTFAATLEGWRVLRSAPLLRWVLLIDLNAMVFGLPRALFPAIGLDALGGDASTVGLLHAAVGAGALVAALTTGWVPSVRRQGRIIMLAAVVWGSSIVGFGLTGELSVAIGFLAAAGAADVISNVFRNAMLQAGVPDDFRGRVTAFKVALSGGGPLLGDWESAQVASVTTPAVSVVSGGVASLVGTAVLGWHGRDLWTYVTPQQPEPDSCTGSLRPDGPTGPPTPHRPLHAMHHVQRVKPTDIEE